MSGQFRRIEDYEGDIKYRFSIAGVRHRHPPDRIRQLFNVSWGEMREVVALANEGSYLEATAFAALPTTAAVTGEVYAEVDWPTNAVGVYGVRVLAAAGGQPYALKRIPWAAYQDYQYRGLFGGSSRPGAPIGYTSRRLPEGIATVETAGKVMIVPVPSGGTYRLWYLQAWTPQVEDGDLFYGHAEFGEHAIYSTMIKMLGPDADSKKMYPIWDKERARVEARIEARANKLEDGQGIEPRNGRFDGYDGDGWGGEW